MTIREVITLGRAERINGWIDSVPPQRLPSRCQYSVYDRYQPPLMSLMILMDEAAQNTAPKPLASFLVSPDITACDFTSGAQNYLKTHGGEAFDAMVSAISSPRKGTGKPRLDARISRKRYTGYNFAR